MQLIVSGETQLTTVPLCEADSNSSGSMLKLGHDMRCIFERRGILYSKYLIDLHTRYSNRYLPIM